MAVAYSDGLDSNSQFLIPNPYASLDYDLDFVCLSKVTDIHRLKLNSRKR